MFFALMITLAMAEFLIFALRPRWLGALAHLPLFLSRNIGPDNTWLEILTRVDPRMGAYRSGLVTDLRQLATLLPAGRLDVRGAETTVSEEGNVALVVVQQRVPFLFRVPFLLVGRLALELKESKLRVRASAYPVFGGASP